MIGRKSGRWKLGGGLHSGTVPIQVRQWRVFILVAEKEGMPLRRAVLTGCRLPLGQEN